MSFSTFINDHLKADVAILIAHLLAIIVICFFFVRFLYRPFRKWLKQRQQLVNAYYQNAEEAKTRAAKTQIAAEKHLKTAQLDAKTLLFNAQTTAKVRAQVVIQTARNQARKTLLLSQKEAAATRAKLDKAIKVEIVKHAFDLSKKVLERELTTQDHQKLITTFIKEIDENHRK